MELNEYQEQAMKTCLEESRNDLYMLFGLNEEVGELSGKYSKAIRKGWVRSDGDNNLRLTVSGFEHEKEVMADIKKECGDVLWMLAGFCSVMGWPLDEIARMNLDKLASRQKRGVIDGKGDNR
jgi:NTP pyrophosphatase (non-canonical NTP hydrolase)